MQDIYVTQISVNRDVSVQNVNLLAKPGSFQFRAIMMENGMLSYLRNALSLNMFKLDFTTRHSNES